MSKLKDFKTVRFLLNGKVLTQEETKAQIQKIINRRGYNPIPHNPCPQ